MPELLTTPQYNDIALKIQGKDPGWYPAMLELCSQYYKDHPCGGALHIVLHDENVDDSCVSWCAGYAHGSKDAPGSEIADLVSLMSIRQRVKLVRSYGLYAR